MRHRLLLLAYPGHLRRRHGAELIDTMVEMSGGSPSRADRRHLVLDGLRERFRPPAGRPVVRLAAVAALLVGGALGAAAGSYAGSLGYAGLPSAGALARQVLDPATSTVEEASTRGGGLLVLGRLATGTDPATALRHTRDRLAAAGWSVTGITTEPVGTAPWQVHGFHASAGGVELRVSAEERPHGALLDIHGWRGLPAGYLPLSTAGLLLGLAGGWLTAVALAHRITGSRRPSAAGFLAAAGLLLLLPPAAAFLLSLGHYLAADPAPIGPLLHDGAPSFGLSLDAIDWLAVPRPLTRLPLEVPAVLGLATLTIAAAVAGPRRSAPAPRPRPEPAGPA